MLTEDKDHKEFLKTIHKILRSLCIHEIISVNQWWEQLIENLALITDNLLTQKLALLMLNRYSN